MFIILETHGGAEYTIVCQNKDGSTICFHRYENAVHYAKANCLDGIVVEID